MRESRSVPPGTSLSESRDGAVDDIGLDRLDSSVVTAKARNHARRKVFDENVGMSRQIVHHLTTVGTREVHGNAFLASIDPREIGALIATARLKLVHNGARFVTCASARNLDESLSL